jgi:hypothetical protein
VTEFATVSVERRLDPSAATELVGASVPELEPTVSTATVARDASSGEPVYAYLPVAGVAELRRAVLETPWGETFRAASGRRNISRTFGYRPRKPMMQGGEACARSALARDAPDTHRVLTEWTRHLGAVLRSVLPEVDQAARDTIDRVLPDWRLGEAEPWTSGVVNKTSTLPYHRDGFNFPVWSAMPVVRRSVTGGYLHIPEYDATIACRDGWALFFPGYELVHGVTPMRTTKPDGYRISVVYYALRGMKDCFTAALETEYGRKRRSDREREMAKRISAGDRSIPGKKRVAK